MQLDRRFTVGRLACNSLIYNILNCMKVPYPRATYVLIT
jgi:hypothetical protein